MMRISLWAAVIQNAGFDRRVIIFVAIFSIFLQRKKIHEALDSGVGSSANRIACRFAMGWLARLLAYSLRRVGGTLCPVGLHPLGASSCRAGGPCEGEVAQQVFSIMSLRSGNGNWF